MEEKEKQMCLRSEIQGFPLERVRSISLQFHTFLEQREGTSKEKKKHLNPRQTCI